MTDCTCGCVCDCAQREAGYVERIQALEIKLRAAEKLLSLRRQEDQAPQATATEACPQQLPAEKNERSPEIFSPPYPRSDIRFYFKPERDNEWACPESQIAWTDGTEEPTVECEVIESHTVFSEPYSHCQLGTEFKAGVLNEGMLSATRSIYEAFREHYPTECFPLWDCPAAVAFNRDEFDTVIVDYGMWRLFGYEPDAGKDTINKVFHLRNAQAHPSKSRTTRNMHRWLSAAEELATKLKDDREVENIRLLKQVMFEEAEKTYAEILELQDNTDTTRQWSRAALSTLE